LIRRDGWAVVALLFLTTLVIWNRLQFDAWLGRFDIATLFLPWCSLLGDRLKAGDDPG
jgi:hypothetical protein